MINNRDLHKPNFEIHATDLHPSTSRLTTFQKGASYFGMKVSNHLPSSTENFSHEEKQFRLSLIDFASRELIYTLAAYFNWNLPKNRSSLLICFRITFCNILQLDLLTLGKYMFYCLLL